MTTTNDELSDALDAVRRAQAQWEKERQEADMRRREAVAEALNRGLTQRQVAEAMGLTRGRVSQIRDGKR